MGEKIRTITDSKKRFPSSYRMLTVIRRRDTNTIQARKIRGFLPVVRQCGTV
jgi:hypothetical protein